MRRFGIKPFPIDPATMDIDGEFLEGLTASLRAGYDASRPIIVAKSEDERIDGYPIDGRHRLYCLGKLQEQKVPLPSPFPVSFVEVKDHLQLRALIAQYESVGMSKNRKYVKAHIEQNLKIIVEEKGEELGDGIFKFIATLGFSNTALVADVVDSVAGKQSKKKPVKPNNGPISSTLPAHLTQRWQEESVYAKPGERLDDKIINFEHKCPDCKAPLKITTDGSGRCLKVEAAHKIAK